MKAIEIDSLCKRYSGGVQALDGISLGVKEGDFFGLLGPNGAGKTTTIGIIKALDSFQGKSVQRVSASDRELIEQFTGGGTQPVMAQEFLEAVYDGDKRVLMLGEHFLGASLRRPREGYHANFAMSDALATTLTATEQQIVEELGPWLVEHGIHFAGLDFIGETLTEINITCPTGIMQISELDGKNLAQEMVDYFMRLCGNDNRAGA